MRRILYFIIVVNLMFLVNVTCVQSQNEDEQIISMLKEFYIAHNAVWTTVPTLSPDIFEWKLDSLQEKYCTTKLRKEAKKYLEDGYDLMTNEQGFGIESLSTLSIVKDSSKTSSYIVSYISSDFDASNKPVKQQVTLHVAVVKENGKYKIDEVW